MFLNECSECMHAKKLASLVSEIKYEDSEMVIETESELAQLESEDPLYPSILGGLVFPNYQGGNSIKNIMA